MSSRPLFSITWPSREGVATYLFLIAVVWSVPASPTVGPWGGIGLCAGGLGGAAVALAYWRERTQETQQPRLHGFGTALLGLGAFFWGLAALL